MRADPVLLAVRADVHLDAAVGELARLAGGPGVGIILFRSDDPAGVGGGVGVAFMFLSGALFVSAARRLRRKRTPTLFVIAAPLVWLSAFMFWPALDSATARSTFFSTFMAACFFMCAVECWRGRGAANPGDWHVSHRSLSRICFYWRGSALHGAKTQHAM